MEEIEEATRAAEAHDFIQSFTDGYNTLLGRGGINLSGGQNSVSASRVPCSVNPRY